MILEGENRIIEMFQRFSIMLSDLWMKISCLLVFCITVSNSEEHHSALQCDLTMRNYTFDYKYSQDGDIIIGGIFTVHSWVSQWSHRGEPFPNQMCSAVHQREYRHLRAFIFAIDEINRNPDILPNVTLGYHVYDSCGNVNKAIKDVLQILSGHKMTAPNYSCMERGTVAGFIGDLRSVTTFPMAQLLSFYGYAQISYGARDPLLSDRRLYPNFFRTVPDDQIQYVAIVKLLERFRWNWVGIITSDDESGERELQQLSKQFKDHGICIESKIFISKESYEDIPLCLQTSSTEIIIICGSISRTFLKFLLNAADILINKTLILPGSWSHVIEMSDIVNCSLVFVPPDCSIPGMQEYFDNIRPSSHTSDMLLEDIWINDFRCFSGNAIKNLLIPLTSRRPLYNCTGEERFEKCLHFPSDSTPCQVYIAVSTMAQALHNVYLSSNKNSTANDLKIYGYNLINSIKRVHYKDQQNKDIFFNEKGEVPTTLNVMNWVTTDMVNDFILLRTYVGKFDASFPEDQQLYMEPWQISWRHNRMPRGRCSEECVPGSRKALKEGYHICCYDCIPCSKGEFTNVSDSENCQTCPDNEWPNLAKNACFSKVYEFLSYEDTVALLFSITSVFFVIISVVITVQFALSWDAPIVKANNRNLSFILLVSLKLSLLCVFMFLGRPMNFTCILRQISFGVIFTVAVSSVLAKTIMVCIAFKATRPGSYWRKWMGVKLPNSVVLICSSVQVLNGVMWLSVSPPFQEYNMDSYPGKIIIQCNEGSVLAFYFMLGYMGFLAAVSFLLAFMVRTLPDIFNEAKYITFSMLVFCSVWIGSIPAYLSSKGKHMVIVEIFAILASSIGILSCMFFPKCYNLVVRPEMNSKIILSQKFSS